MASVEELLSAVSGIIGAISGIVGSIVALLSCWANRRRRDKPGGMRPSYADRQQWRVRRWAGIAVACLGGALAGAVMFWDLHSVVAASFAAGLAVGSVPVLVMSGRARRTISLVAVDHIADVSEHLDLAGHAYEPDLVCDREEASVSLERGAYHLKVRRWLVNQAKEPIAQVLMT
ncbi:hypothetical protein [Allorhizocola rhizosphaerae]|uniref:hypothetical protein n=1 Tax=Allorhizocola rhizosphaerae TaxID=1872709 RepID=UPI0013C30371|nr:hypothetical protein [Allorhizocola rhizosphaerae]